MAENPSSQGSMTCWGNTICLSGGYLSIWREKTRALHCCHPLLSRESDCLLRNHVRQLSTPRSYFDRLRPLRPSRSSARWTT